MKPTIAIIGVSGYARLVFHSLCHVLESSGARIAAATVINPQEEEEACQCITAQGGVLFSDYRQMLEQFRGRLDLCLIPTSIHLHAPMVLDALRAGANVLVEKPLSGSLEEGQSIVAAAAAAGRFVAVSYQDMYAPETWDIKRFLASGELGPIQSIQITGSWPRGESYYTRNRWAGKTHCDGRPVFDSPLNNAFAHFVNLALFFAAPAIDEVAHVEKAGGSLLRFFPIETYDTAVVRHTTREGISIEYNFTHAHPEREDPCMTVRLEHGTLTWTLDKEAVAARTGGEAVKKWAVDGMEPKRQQMIRSVIECLGTSRVPLFPAALALRQIEAIEKTNALPIADGFSVLPPSFAKERRGPWDFVEGLAPYLRQEAAALFGGLR